MLSYLIINHKNISEFQNSITDFYQNHYQKEYLSATKNTPLFVVCLKNKTIVGACRILTDFNRFAFLLDLRVQEDMRNQGIAQKIIKKSIKICKKLKIDHINLSTSPKQDWLVGFYEKLGFKKVKSYAHMEYKGN